MSPFLATIVYTALAIWALRTDARNGFRFTSALWLPFIWLLILGSRSPSFWLGPGAVEGGEFEGNVIDRNLYLALAIMAVIVLSRRGANWGALIRDNKAMSLMYAYLLFSCIWSDHPFVTFKRWFKELTTFSILLVFISEYDPRKAIQAVFTRCAVLLFLCSILFIKYYPDLGRVYSSATGEVQTTGVTTQKNTLGEIVLIFGLMFIWRMQTSTLTQLQLSKFKRYFLPLAFLALGVWLLLLSDSKTSLICLLAGMIVMVSHKLPIIRTSPKYFVTFCVVLIPLFMALNSLFGLSGMLLELAGRDATFTGRTGIWQVAKDHPTNPLLGSGYLMYWDELGEFYINEDPVRLKTAHNGYLDVYLDGGILGLVFFGAMLISAANLAIKRYLTGSSFGRLCFAMLIVTVLSNFSESSFVRRGPLWFTFLLFAVEFGHVFPGRDKLLSDTEGRPANTL